MPRVKPLRHAHKKPRFSIDFPLGVRYTQSMNTYKDDLTDALDMLEAAIWQDCGSVKDDSVDSRFITIHAEAIRFLAKYGRVIIDSDYGGRNVTGTFTNRKAW